jgi:hypothetical protein
MLRLLGMARLVLSDDHWTTDNREKRKDWQ